MSIRDELAKISSIWMQIKSPPGAWILEEFLVRVGIECPAQALPRGYPKMAEKVCFHNAAKLVSRRRNLRYCEGLVLFRNFSFPLPIHHAWAIDEQNRVIDPTLWDPLAFDYIGYPIAPAERRRWTTPLNDSVLDTGIARNAAFMVKHCPELLSLIDEQYHEYIFKKACPARS